MLICFMVGIYSSLSAGRRIVIAAVALSFAIGAYQPLLIIACIVVGGVWINRHFQSQFDLKIAAIEASTLLFSVIFYIIIAVSIKSLFGNSDDSVAARGGFIAFADLFARFKFALFNLHRPFGGAEPTMGRGLLMLVSGWFVCVVGLALFRSIRSGLIVCAFLAVTALAALIPPLLLATVSLPARAIFPGITAFGVGVLLLGVLLNPFLRVILAGTGGVLGFLVCVASFSILQDQLRLNRWDMSRLQLIAHDVLRLNDGARPDVLVFVGRPWSHGLILGSAGNDRNLSALAIEWAVNPALREATGVPWVARSVTCSPEMAPFFGRVRSNEGRTNEAQQVQR